MRTRGYVFTIDALFSMALIASVAYSFTIFTTQPGHSAKITNLQALAWDYARLNSDGLMDAAAFDAVTGLSVYSDLSLVPSLDEKRLVVRAVHYRYNSTCASNDCTFNCTLSKTEAMACLFTQSINISGAGIYNESWIAA